MPAAIQETRTTNGTTAAANVLACDYSVSGIFLGTWVLQALMNGSWTTVATGTDIGSLTRFHQFAEPRQVRFTVTGITMGSIELNLSGRTNREAR